MRIFMTGGAGFLGRAIMRRTSLILPAEDVQFTIYSRDSAKHTRARHEFPQATYVLGDVRDEERLEAAMAGHDVVIHAGAMKYVPEGEKNVWEAVEVNVAGSENGITAALAAGRRMTYGKWIYCRTPSRVTVLFVDDNGTVGSASSLHQGRGWELLHSTGNVSDANATTLTTRIDVTNAAGAVDLWWNRGWFYFGEADRITDLYDGSKAFRPRRDDTTQRIYLSFAPTRGYQLRLQGRNTLSLLGTTASTQVTNTMELDAISEQVLFAEAARILYGRQVFSSDEFPTLAPKIAKADELLTEMKKWAQQPMSTATIRGPYS